MNSHGRKPLISALRDYRHQWPAEAGTVDRFIEFVSSNPDCFDRSLREGHVTGSAWVVDREGRRVLLTHHRKLGKWLQLGGHADGESDVHKAALREVAEESGLTDVVPVGAGIFDVDIHWIPERGSEPGHYHYDVRYAMQATTSEDYVVSDESHDLGWIEVARITSVTMEPSMLRMASKWMERQPS